jgi:DNA polymerase III alpha subunit
MISTHLSTSNKNSINSIVRGILHHGLDNIRYAQTDDDISIYVNRINQEKLDYPLPGESCDPQDWFIPNEYKNMDIEKFLIDICPQENQERLKKELKLFQKNNMTMVLKTMKYLVDIFRKNKIVWGVGRGSSVSSYALFLIGIHKIDSVKYDLSIDEFFKGEENG